MEKPQFKPRCAYIESPFLTAPYPLLRAKRKEIREAGRKAGKRKSEGKSSVNGRPLCKKQQQDQCESRAPLDQVTFRFSNLEMRDGKFQILMSLVGMQMPFWG